MKHPVLILVALLFAAFTVSAAEAPAKKKAGARQPAPLPANVEKRAVPCECPAVLKTSATQQLLYASCPAG